MPASELGHPPARRLNWKLAEIKREADGTYALAYDTPEGRTVVRARSVALTVPAYTAADLLRSAAVGAGVGVFSVDHRSSQLTAQRSVALTRTAHTLALALLQSPPP